MLEVPWPVKTVNTGEGSAKTTQRPQDLFFQIPGFRRIVEHIRGPHMFAAVWQTWFAACSCEDVRCTAVYIIHVFDLVPLVCPFPGEYQGLSCGFSGSPHQEQSFGPVQFHGHPTTELLSAKPSTRAPSFGWGFHLHEGRLRATVRHRASQDGKGLGQN